MPGVASRGMRVSGARLAMVASAIVATIGVASRSYATCKVCPYAKLSPGRRGGGTRDCLSAEADALIVRDRRPAKALEAQMACAQRI